MMKYFCLDVSGSMTSEQIQMAVEKINAAAKQGDFFLMFDCDAYGPWPIEDALGKIYADPEDMVRTLCPQHRGRGGTDARSALKAIITHEKTRNVTSSHRVLVSDGELMEGDLKLFDEFIEVK